MTAVISFLIVLLLSLIVSRVAAVALMLTGLSREVARFQARSAMTGTGYTTKESEYVVNHPVRRRIITAVMVLRNAGLVTAVSSLVLSFSDAGQGDDVGLRLALILGGTLVVWLLARSHWVDRAMTRVIRWALNRWTRIEARDFVSLLDLSGDYAVRELNVRAGDWLEGRTIRESRLQEEGILILGIQAPGGDFVGAPTPDTRIRENDSLVLYGRADAIAELDERRSGREGERRHRESVVEQEEAEQEETREREENRRESA